MNFTSLSIFFHYISCALTLALPIIGVSIGQGLTGLAALKALNMQPSTHNEINRTLIIGLALIETAAILCFIAAIRLFISGPYSDIPQASFMHYGELGIFFALGISGFVSGIASSFPSSKACLAVAKQPFFANKIQLLMVITQSLMQTPVIFGFIIATLIQNQLTSLFCSDITDTFRLIASGISIGIGSIGPTLGLAYLAKQSCESSGSCRTLFSKILYFTIASSALIESAVIFCFVVSFVLLNPPTSHYFIMNRGIIFLFAGVAMACGTVAVGISSGKLSAKSCKIFTEKPELYNLISKTSLFSQVFIETCSIYALIVALGLIFM